ncbi:MAG: ribosome small subunit-dependent GTPase A [Fibrobacteres bacterium]|jgi:ribosome biogenesis GTPase|nr:ribosome small subunit-dependent GTPase A [Fibrobacterota bacterium]
MSLEDFGYDSRLEASRLANGYQDLEIGRVVAEHRTRHIVATISGEVDAEVKGSIRFSATARADLPAVGDWVALDRPEASSALIHAILPRSSAISRQASGGSGEVQVIATNVDHAILVQAIDRDFNLNRMDRYLAICRDARIAPVVLLTKIDLIDPARLAEIRREAETRTGGAPVLAVTSNTPDGYASLESLMERGRTYCLLGSSGVGKSTLLNRLSGREVMRTDAISGSTGKGRHVTSHRELVVLDNGAILIDNPGMREVGLALGETRIESGLGPMAPYDGYCRYRDCTHTAEAGCAILAALESGRIDRSAYENWRKLEKEREHFESTTAQRRKKDRSFGKMVDSYKKTMGRSER